MSTTRMLAARLRVVALGLVAVLLGAGLALAPAAGANAYNFDVDLTLTVTTKSGAPVRGLLIQIVPVDESNTFTKGTTELGAGRYRAVGIESGADYVISLRSDFPNMPRGPSFDQYAGGTSLIESAQIFSWTPGDHAVALTIGGTSTISGKVTTSTGAAVASGTVTAYRFDGSGWTYADEVRTERTGLYSLTRLESGSYRLEFAAAPGGNYLSEYSGNTRDFDAAQSVFVAPGATGVASASLAIGGAISGVLIDHYTSFGEPWPFLFGEARAYRLLDTPPGAPLEIDWSAPYFVSNRTSLDGRWTVGGLPPGRYAVSVYDEEELAYPEWMTSEQLGYRYRWVSATRYGTTSLDAATVFTVTTGSTKKAPTIELDWFPIDDWSSVAFWVNSGGVDLEGAKYVMYSDERPDVRASVGHLVVWRDGRRQFGWFGNNDQTFVAPGWYTVIVSKPGYDTAVRSVYIREGYDESFSISLTPRSSAFTFLSGTISGGLSLGDELSIDVMTTLDDGAGTDQDVSYSFQWYRGSRPIFGATNSSYVTQPADVGQMISVRYSAAETNNLVFTYRSEIISDVAIVGVIEPGPAPTNVTAPWISSPTTPKPGVTLTANSGVWSTTGLKFDYQWYSDGAPIAGATSRTFTLTALEATHDITVELVATKPGHPASDVVVSDPVPVENLSAPTQTKPSVVTKSTAGLPAGQVRYTVTPGTWNVPGLTFSYLWSVDGAGVGVFANSYVVDTATQGGSVIQVKVYAEKQGYADTNQTVMVQKGAAPTGTLDITDETTSSPVDALSQTELGHVLRATPSITYPTAGGGTVTTTYTWQRSTTGTGGWTTITGAKQPTYTPGLADLNRFLRVLTTTSSTLYLPVVQTASAGKAVPRTELSTGIPPTASITGSSSVSTTHRAAVSGAWPLSGVTLSYRWLTCAADCSTPASFTVVTKATTSSWLPPAAVAGREAVVEVTASKPGYAPLTVRSAAIVLDPLTAVTGFTPPTITGGLIAGDGAVGRPLTVKPGTFDVTVTRSYQWQYCDSSLGACVVDDDFITVGTNSTSYVPTAIGVIRVRETAARTGLTSVVQFSGPIDVEPGTLMAKIAPTVTTSGDTYTVNPGTTVPGTTAVAYQWYLDGDPVGAGGASLTDATVGASLHVVVTLTRDGYSPRTVTLVPRKGTAPTATGTITGSAYGDTFVAPNDFTYPATATPAPVTTYQWYSNGTAIPRATAATFTPSTAYLGKNIAVRVTSTSPFYAPKSYTTPGVVVQKADAPAGSPTIVSSTGAIKPGAKLSVALDPGSWSTTGLTFSYLWQSSPNGVTWANLSTASMYTLLPTQPGVQVRVLVTARKTGYTDAVVPLDAGTVDWLGPIVNASEPTLGGPLLSGAASAVGSTLTAGPGLWNVAGLTYVYEWFRDGIIVPGATAATLTPTAEYYGDQLQVRVTAKAPGYQPVTAFSNIVVVGQGTAPSATTAPKITRSGNLLTATPGLWNVDGLVFSFQWLLDGSPIVGATSSTHTIAATGIYGVVVTATRDGYAPGSRTIAMTAAISPI